MHTSTRVLGSYKAKLSGADWTGAKCEGKIRNALKHLSRFGLGRSLQDGLCDCSWHLKPGMESKIGFVDCVNHKCI